MKVADALTMPSVTVLPAGVLKTTVAAVVGEIVSTEREMAAALTAPAMRPNNLRGDDEAAKLARKDSNAEKWSGCGIGRTSVKRIVPRTINQVAQRRLVQRSPLSRKYFLLVRRRSISSTEH